MNYNIIGDIPGHADELEALLLKVGYEKQDDTYAHPEKRKVIFVGDLVDRGPKIRETLHLVKAMCDAGNAQAVMGNHEFNAICFHTPDAKNRGFYRKHGLKEIEQHLKTLRQFKGHEKEFQEFLKWFKQLPLFLEFENFRVVHACWDNKHIDWIRRNYKGINTEFLALANDKNNPGFVYEVIDETLKGKEYRLPEGLSFTDKDGQARHKCRIKWWAKLGEVSVYKDVLMACPPEIADAPIPDPASLYFYSDSKPVFFGHYWLTGTPFIENEKAVCLDWLWRKGEFW